MSWPRTTALALLSLTVPPYVEVPTEAPLPRGEIRINEAPLAKTWTRRSAEIRASRVRLNGLGARTHANWVLYRLPFSTTERERIRFVRFTPRVASRTDVGALRIGSVCLAMPSRGGINEWSLYTVSGVGYTERFGWHIAPPTDDPTIVGINVPTRVANYVACGWDKGHLRDPQEWTLDVEWEER